MNQMGKIYVRWARRADWEPAMAMIWDTFLKFEGEDYSQEGIEKFREFITDRELYESYLDGKYRLMVAVCEGEIVGAASVRNGNFLSLLFVKDRFQKHGVGRYLLEQICRYLEEKQGYQSIWLRSSPVAVDFYRKQGFQILRPEENLGGIRVTLMEKHFSKSSKFKGEYHEIFKH